jgi:hypothetical protein
MNRIIGFAVLAIGVILLGFAFHSTNAPLEQITESLTGRYSSETMWYFAAGIAAVVGGGLLAAFGSRK